MFSQSMGNMQNVFYGRPLTIITPANRRKCLNQEEEGADFAEL